MDNGRSAHVLDTVVIGGGVAGLETVMALRALAGPRVRLTLVSPQRDFVYRPMSVAEPFGLGSAHKYPLAEIAADFDVDLVHDELRSVLPQAQSVFLGSGDERGYGALVLALGARPVTVWDHVPTFRGPGDGDVVRALLEDLVHGRAESAAFVVPPGVTWPLPLYELALMTARRAAKAGRSPELVVFTPEKRPLAMFGDEASDQVAAELEQAGVRLARSARVDVSRDGDLVIPFEETPLRFERVLAIPRLAGPAPRGVPADDDGFIPIDAHGIVQGAEHLYAAGDGTNFPVKQGGIATQQADAVAEVIAKRSGAAIDPRPFRAVLRAQMLTGGDPRFLRTDLNSRASEVSQASAAPLWWPVAKIAGTYLAPYLAARDAAAGQPAESAEAGGPWDRERLVTVPDYFEDSPYGE